jgi:hypothetical protein
MYQDWGKMRAMTDKVPQSDLEMDGIVAKAVIDCC